MKAQVGTFNKEKAQYTVRAFSMVVKTDGSFAALILSHADHCC